MKARDTAQQLLRAAVSGRVRFLPAANNSVRLLRLGREVKLTMDFSDMQHETAAFLTRRTTYNHCVRLPALPRPQTSCSWTGTTSSGGSRPRWHGRRGHPRLSHPSPNQWKEKHLEHQLLGFRTTHTSAQFVNIALAISRWETNQLGWRRPEMTGEPRADCSVSSWAKWSRTQHLFYDPPPLSFFPPYYFSNLILRLHADNDITMVFVVRLAAQNVSLNPRLRVRAVERGAK